MADNIKFLSGNKLSLPDAVINGQVYFAITDEENRQGQILFDKNNKRFSMSDTSVAAAYGTCETRHFNSEKVIILSSESDNINFRAGSILFVKSSEQNSAAFPMFSIYKSDAITAVLTSVFVFYQGSQVISANAEKAGEKDFLLAYVYDGQFFHYMGGYGDESKGQYQNYTKKTCFIDNETIPAYNLVGVNRDGKLVSANKTAFLAGGPLYITISQLKANTKEVTFSLFERGSNLLLLNNENEINGTAYSPIYLKGRINGDYFEPDIAEPFVCQLSSTTNNNYIYLGEINNYLSNNNNYTYINFSFNHQIYTSYDGKKQLYGAVPEHLAHSLTIGDYVYNGSADIIIPVYNGETV